MLGYEAASFDDSGLLPARKHWHYWLQTIPAVQKVAIASLLFLSPLALMVWSTSSAASTTLLATDSASRWHGVSLGGWLVMEINPSKRDADSPMDLRPFWMYDQIEANSELDFVAALRKEKGDEYAIATMKNHWSGYLTDEMLDAAQALGVDTARIPVGFWIMDAPEGGSSPLEYGISPEGFVTGGLNHLKAMLAKLAQRGIGALVDLHAHPCNSACVSDGQYCATTLAFAPAGNGIGDIGNGGLGLIRDMPRCGGGVYPTSRKPREGEMTWGDVGVNAVGAMAQWISELPDELQSAVVALQLANEPALGTSTSTNDAINEFYTRAHKAARAHLPATPLVLSFMGPSPTVIDFLAGLQADDRAVPAGVSPVVADHHYYLNWQAPVGTTMGWPEIHHRACAPATHAAATECVDSEGLPVGDCSVLVYELAKQPAIVGEWSLATNHDALLDLSSPDTVRHLARLYKEQLEVFALNPSVRGAFFWTLRMGSGWDPRPSDAHPHGYQLEGSSAWAALKSYPFSVWSLLEMAKAGVAAPLNASYLGSCSGVLVG